MTLTVTTLDTEKPVISISTPEQALVGDEVEVKYNVTDNVSSGSDLEVLVSVTKDGNKVNLTNNKFTAEEGTYTITVSAKDAAGNIHQETKDVVVKSNDTTKPTVSITTAGTADLGEIVLITYTVSDDKTAANKLTVVVEVSKDGQVLTISGNKFTAEEGTYTITVTVTDEAGNSNSATSTVTVSAPQQPAKKGCGGSVIASIFGISLLGAVTISLKKKREE